MFHAKLGAAMTSEMVRRLKKLHEGEKKVKGRHMPYRCPAGFLTIGWGRNLDAKGISDAAAEFLLTEDINEVQSQLAPIDWFQLLSEVRRAVLVDMAFNMGVSKLFQFRKMIRALAVQDYRVAAAEMKDSAWYRQTGTRARRLVKMMDSDTWPEDV